MNGRLSATLLLPFDASSIDFGKCWLNLIRAISPNLAPISCGQFEDTLVDCRADSIGDVVARSWKDMFLWKAKDASGIFSMPMSDVHSAMFIYGKVASTVVVDVVHLFDRMVDKFPIDFGWIHVVGEDELRDLRRCDSYRLFQPFSSGVHSKTIIRGIPNLGWRTYFGSPYTSKLKAHDVGSLEGIVVKEFGRAERSGVCVQLGDSAMAPLDNYLAFNVMRESVKKTIGTEMFCSAGKDAEWTPTFERVA